MSDQPGQRGHERFAVPTDAGRVTLSPMAHSRAGAWCQVGPQRYWGTWWMGAGDGVANSNRKEI